MKKVISIIAAVSLAGALFVGCGSAKEEKKEAVSEAVEAASEAASAVSEAASETVSKSEQASAETVGAYSWLGLQDMPRCNYLNALATYHYIREYTSYTAGFVTETTEAVDGINTYQSSDNTKSYSIDGKVIGINESSKMYSEADATSNAEEARKNLEDYQASGENWTGRAFVGTGKEAIPGYSEKTGDTTEYEYYEYNYPASAEVGLPVIERFYMKDGDVYATCKTTYMEDEPLGQVTEVIKSISINIPEGTFDIPDLEGYEKLKLG